MWRTHVLPFFSALDWPNLVASTLLSGGGLGFLAKGLYDRYVSGKDLPYPISGQWYSAEFDPKGTERSEENPIQLSGGNTFLRVRVKRRIGRNVLVKALGPVEGLPQAVPTQWIAHGQLVQGDTLVGTWRSTIADTNRHGTAMLRFLDYGRAVGYWTGAFQGAHPVYGYWIMSRSQQDVERLAADALARTAFTILDVASIVARYPPPTTAPQ